MFSNIFLTIRCASENIFVVLGFPIYIIVEGEKDFCLLFFFLIEISMSTEGLGFGLFYFNLMPEKIQGMNYYPHIHKALITSEMSSEICLQNSDFVFA